MRKTISYAWAVANLSVILAGFAAVYGVIVYRQAIQDWWVLQNYTPPAEIQQLAADTTMIGQGKDLFFVSDPKVQESAEFNQNCTDHGEKSLVLGCYTKQRIYIYRVSDTRLTGVVQVTAAHEMLHAAYERLDEKEKIDINALIEAQLATISDQRLQDLIKLYDEHKPDMRLNELHSILATEYTTLSPQLEEYYRRYFADRSKVVAFAANYASVFTASQNKIAGLSRQLDTLKSQIDKNTSELNRQQAELEDSATELNSLRQTDPEAYNQRVPTYNTQVREYNNLVVSIRSLIQKFNELVVEHNNEATAQSDLYHGLDSHYQTVE